MIKKKKRSNEVILLTQLQSFTNNQEWGVKKKINSFENALSSKCMIILILFTRSNKDKNTQKKYYKNCIQIFHRNL